MKLNNSRGAFLQGSESFRIIPQPHGGEVSSLCFGILKADDTLALLQIVLLAFLK